MTAAPDTYIRSGKVRDLYAIGNDRLLLVASDRLSAFDVVLPTPIPDKGRVLTGLSRFWFEATRDIVPNHVLGTNPAAVPAGTVPAEVAGDLRGRMLLCRRATVLPVEVVVRGYLSGSGWKEYRSTGAVCGVALPAGLRESDRLPEPVLTPATKAEAGEHDENIDFRTMVGALERIAVRDGGVGSPRDLAERVRDVALALYRRAATTCESVGLILADTKFEMGLVDGELILIDEVLTPDSSRFWDAATYAPGGPQASFDKQFVRDWLEGVSWDKTAPGPELPPDVVAGTRMRYAQAFERITGASFDRYLEEDVIAR
ncbi:MAG: phosphoribosylaminoimidazolesuccinocarboxamide synthase [Chloroflexi bacterium]|nr:phosphoribosylaminoimidazolesuccinocarboxamide synthase [Chloroflexota bacterium]